MTIQMSAFPFSLSFKLDWIDRANNPAKPIQAKAIKYSIKACIGVRIHASPVAICKIPQRNPDIVLAINPHRKAITKMGTIAKEIEIDGPNLIEGKKSNIIARAAKMAISIIVCSLNLFIKKYPPNMYLIIRTIGGHNKTSQRTDHVIIPTFLR